VGDLYTLSKSATVNRVGGAFETDKSSQTRRAPESGALIILSQENSIFYFSQKKRSAKLNFLQKFEYSAKI